MFSNEYSKWTKRKLFCRLNGLFCAIQITMFLHCFLKVFHKFCKIISQKQKRHLQIFPSKVIYFLIGYLLLKTTKQLRRMTHRSHNLCSIKRMRDKTTNCQKRIKPHILKTGQNHRFVMIMNASFVSLCKYKNSWKWKRLSIFIDKYQVNYKYTNRILMRLKYYCKNQKIQILVVFNMKIFPHGHK